MAKKRLVTIKDVKGQVGVTESINTYQANAILEAQNEISHLESELDRLGSWNPIGTLKASAFEDNPLTFLDARLTDKKSKGHCSQGNIRATWGMSDDGIWTIEITTADGKGAVQHIILPTDERQFDSVQIVNDTIVVLATETGYSGRNGSCLFTCYQASGDGENVVMVMTHLGYFEVGYIQRPIVLGFSTYSGPMFMVTQGSAADIRAKRLDFHPPRNTVNPRYYTYIHRATNALVCGDKYGNQIYCDSPRNNAWPHWNATPNNPYLNAHVVGITGNRVVYLIGKYNSKRIYVSDADDILKSTEVGTVDGKYWKSMSLCGDMLLLSDSSRKVIIRLNIATGVKETKRFEKSFHALAQNDKGVFITFQENGNFVNYFLDTKKISSVPVTPTSFTKLLTASHQTDASFEFVVEKGNLVINNDASKTELMDGDGNFTAAMSVFETTQ